MLPGGKSTVPVQHLFLLCQVVHPVGHAAQGDFPKSSQLISCKKVLQSSLGLHSLVYLTLFHAFDQFFRFDIHKLYLICPVEHAVRDGLSYHDGCNAGHIVIEAFQMLNVHCGIHIDPMLQKLLNILIPFSVTAALNIGMSQFIYQDHLGTAF